jgi:hypothetical protein
MNKCFIIIPLFALISCGSEPWSKEERTEFKNNCLDSGADNNYCICYQEKAMAAHPNYDEMKDISFEEAVELSIDCR